MALKAVHHDRAPRVYPKLDHCEVNPTHTEPQPDTAGGHDTRETQPPTTPLYFIPGPMALKVVVAKTLLPGSLCVHVSGLFCYRVRVRVTC